MIVISANNLTKEYDGTNLVLDKVSFAVNRGERIGIIGINGAGKTTLLRMLAGQLPQEGGDFFVSSDLRVGYLEQDGGFDSERTVMEEVEKAVREVVAPEKTIVSMPSTVTSATGSLSMIYRTQVAAMIIRVIVECAILSSFQLRSFIAN